MFRIYELLPRSKFKSLNALAKSMGMDYKTLKMIADGETPNPTIKSCEAIAEKLGVNVEQLRGRAPIPALDEKKRAKA